jgi:hypothetical protein
MKRHRHTPEQIVRKLREGDRLLNEGKDLTEVLRHLEVSESSWNRWRNQYGGMKANEAKRLRARSGRAGASRFGGASVLVCFRVRPLWYRDPEHDVDDEPGSAAQRQGEKDGSHERRIGAEVFGEPAGYSRDSAVGGAAVQLCRVHVVPFAWTTGTSV